MDYFLKHFGIKNKKSLQVSHVRLLFLRDFLVYLKAKFDDCGIGWPDFSSGWSDGRGEFRVTIKSQTQRLVEIVSDKGPRPTKANLEQKQYTQEIQKLSEGFFAYAGKKVFVISWMT